MKRFSVFFITIISAFLLFGCGSDSSSEEVEEETPDTIEQVADDEIKDYGSLSYSELEVLAYEDDAEACYYLAMIYEYGNDEVNQDFAQAIQWYTTAAGLDYAKAYTSLGYFYLTGTGCDVDLETAQTDFEQALSLGDDAAKVGLGRTILAGLSDEELEEITTAPEKPEVKLEDALLEDASIDQNINGTSSDDEADIATDEAELETTDIDEASDDADSRSADANDSDELFTKVSTACNYIQEAADAGNLDGVYYLGYLYENGIGLEGNYETAKSCYELVISSESDDILDQYAINNSYVSLGLMYINCDVFTGETYDEDASNGLALEYFEKAADNGFAKAQFYCGQVYENGIGVDRDYETAMDYYLSAAESDFAPALNQIGYLYYNGYGVDVNFSSAVYYQKLAALQGYAPAQVNLGYLYENGYGVERNLQTALSYYELAADAGIDGANDAAIRVRALINNEEAQ